MSLLDRSRSTGPKQWSEGRVHPDGPDLPGQAIQVRTPDREAYAWLQLKNRLSSHSTVS
jgi:hypothetical protein